MSKRCRFCGLPSETIVCEDCHLKERLKQFKELNNSFYSRFHVDYFSTSQILAIACLARPDDMLKILAADLKYQSLTTGFTEDEKPGENKESIEKWAKIEIGLTYFHAVETLFRLFLGHSYPKLYDSDIDLPLCPWLEISNLKNFRNFKMQVRKLIDNELPDIKKKIAQVFLGLAEYPGEDVIDLTLEQWQEGIRNIHEHLIHFAKDLLNNDEYNAFKHGLAVFHGIGKFEINDGSVLGRRGDALTTLTLVEDSPPMDYLIWAQRLSFFDVDFRMALTVMTERLMKQIISIAKGRYLREKGIQFQSFHTLSYEKLVAATSDGKNPIQILDPTIPLWPKLRKEKGTVADKGEGVLVSLLAENKKGFCSLGFSGCSASRTSGRIMKIRLNGPHRNKTAIFACPSCFNQQIQHGNWSLNTN